MSNDPLESVFNQDTGLTAEEQLEAIAEQATQVDPDLMDMLARLEVLAARRRKDPALEAEYERLRNAASAIINDTGPRWFLDEDGHKRIAYRQAPMNVDVELDELVRQVAEGEIDVDLDTVAPRKVNKEELKKAVATGRIPAAKFLRMATLREGTAFVRFSSDEQNDDG